MPSKVVYCRCLLDKLSAPNPCSGVRNLIPRVIIPYFQKDNSVEVRYVSLHVFLWFIDVCLIEPASINELALIADDLKLGIVETDLKQYHSE